ncbi:YiiQ family protein [Photorhabdus antumapuensis]|uniref:YiiQ family protein n=1 Tax=Photorhabdus antumapuensis TaxID=2862867 RepID=UPI0037C62EE9|nr:YiiQ family protein [Photorhabdus antumapuensis]
MKMDVNKFPTIILAASSVGLPLVANADKSTTTEPTVQAIYLLPNAPSFDETIPRFREKYNRRNPTLPLREYRVIISKNIYLPLTRAASKINEKLYSSAVLERGSEKIKSLQLTLLPSENTAETQQNQMLAEQYMVALMRHFNPTLSQEQSKENIDNLLINSKKSPFYSHNIGAIRYIVVNSSEKTLTFAIEPIKLWLSEPDN